MTDEYENRSDINPEESAGTGTEHATGTQQQGGIAGQPGEVVETDLEARKWASFCHLLGILNIFGPLVMWILKKDEYSFVDDQGKEAVNFQISIAIYLAVSVALIPACGLGLVLFPLVSIFALVMLIIATIQANSGIAYRYPLTIRFIK